MTRMEPIREPLKELARQQGWDVHHGRLKRDGKVSLALVRICLTPGDLLSLAGPLEGLDQVIAYLGQESAEHLALDRSQFDYRRVFVSNPKIVSQTLKGINLPQQFGAGAFALAGIVKIILAQLLVALPN